MNIGDKSQLALRAEVSLTSDETEKTGLLDIEAI